MMNYENRILSGNFLYYDTDGDVNEVYISKVIYSKRATIVLWSDGTKTVTNCDSKDPYSPESGLMHCIVKKLAGRQHYSNLLFNWTPQPVLTDEDGNPLVDQQITLQEVRKKELLNKSKNK